MRKLVFLLCMLPVFLAAQIQNWQTLDSLVQQQYLVGAYREGFKTMQRCLAQVKADSLPTEQYLPVLLKEAMFTEKLGHYWRADSLIQEVVHLFRAKKQTTHPDYPIALNTFGFIQMLLGDYKQAKRMVLQAKMAQEHMADTLTLLYAQTIDNLGLLANEQGKYKEAINHYSASINMGVIGKCPLMYRWYISGQFPIAPLRRRKISLLYLIISK